MKKLLLILLFATLASCSSPPPASPPLKLGILSNWPTYATAFIAQEKGLFAKHGVQVTLILMPIEYTDTLKSYKEGKVDGIYMMLADAITLESEGTATRFVYAANYSDSGDIIVGLPTLNGLSDLKGKKVSFAGFNTFSHLLVLKALERVGVREGEFEAANIIHSGVLNALETGKIQAGQVSGAEIVDTLNKGYKVLAKAGEIPHLMIEGLAMNAKVVNTRREEVQKLVTSLVEAMEVLKRSPEEGLSIIAKYTGTSKAGLESTLKGLYVFTLQENQEVFKSGSILHQGGQEIIDFFHQKGVLINRPDLNIIVSGQFINAIGGKP